MNNAWNIGASPARDARFATPSPIPWSGLSRLTHRVRDVFTTPSSGPRVPTGLPLPPRDGDKSSKRGSVSTSFFPRPDTPNPRRNSWVPASPPTTPPAVFDSTFPTLGSSATVATRIVPQPPSTRTDAERIKEEWRSRQRLAQISLAADPRRTSLPPFVGIKRKSSPRVTPDLIEAFKAEHFGASAAPSAFADGRQGKAGIDGPTQAPSATTPSTQDRYLLSADIFPPEYLLSSASLSRQPSTSQHRRAHSDASDYCPPSLISCHSSASQEASYPPVTPVRSTFDVAGPLRIVVDSPDEVSQVEASSPVPTQAPNYLKTLVVLSPPPRPTRSPKRMSLAV